MSRGFLSPLFNIHSDPFFYPTIISSPVSPSLYIKRLAPEDNEMNNKPSTA